MLHETISKMNIREDFYEGNEYELVTVVTCAIGFTQMIDADGMPLAVEILIGPLHDKRIRVREQAYLISSAVMLPDSNSPKMPVCSKASSRLLASFRPIFSNLSTACS